MYERDGITYGTYGEYLRGKSLRIAYCQSADFKDYTAQKKWDKELDAYKQARDEGIQPAGTTLPKITEARRLSDKVGKAYDASTGTFK